MLSLPRLAAKTLSSHTVSDNVFVQESKKEGYHVEMAGEGETGEGKKALPPSLVFEPPAEEEGQQQQEAARMPKMSLPARMSDLYQVADQLQHRIT